MTSTSSSYRKVRVACQRCRARRIKCDGGVPSCANCAKAGTPCVDVDARNADQLVPRNSITQAKARIQWLEEMIAINLPDFDLSAGPRVEFDGADILAQPEDVSQGPTTGAQHQLAFQSSSNNKRSHASIAENDEEQSFNTEARSVALDLGRLSLNADSREKHYLGSSSGLIFSYLIGTPQSTSDEPVTSGLWNSPGSARQSQQHFEPLHRILISSLPAKDDALSLFLIFVQHVHPDHPILHIQSILHALKTLYLCCDVDTNAETDQNGWPLTIPAFSYNGEIDSTNSLPATPINLPTAMFHCFMVLTLAATVRVGGAQNEFSPSSFYRIAKSVALDALSNTTISSLQGIYLLAIHALMAPAKLNIWTLTYVCTAHCIDLGIHRQQDDLLPSATITRSLLFHSIYSLDRMVATIQGRPLGIRDETFDVKPPTSDAMQAEIDSQILPPKFQLSLKESAYYSLCHFKLDKIISEIKTVFYFLPSRVNSAIWSTDYERHQKRVQHELDSWYAELSNGCPRPQMSDKGRERWLTYLEQQYQATRVLLFQPSQIFRQPSNECLLQCFHAASRQIDCYNSLYEDLDTLHFDFRTIRSIFACGATIIYCFWTSKALQTSQHANALPITLRLCTTLLAVGAIWWPSVKKSRPNFQRLVDLTLQRLTDIQRRDIGHSRKRRPNRSRLENDLDLPFQMVFAQAGIPESQTQSTTFPTHLSYNEEFAPGMPLQDGSLEEVSSDQGRAVDPFNYNDIANDRNMGSNGEFETPSPYDLMNNPAHIEPEIATFLNGYFLDDTSWNSTEIGPPWSFHFGDL